MSLDFLRYVHDVQIENIQVVLVLLDEDTVPTFTENEEIIRPKRLQIHWRFSIRHGRWTVVKITLKGVTISGDEVIRHWYSNSNPCERVYVTPSWILDIVGETKPGEAE